MNLTSWLIAARTQQGKVRSEEAGPQRGAGAAVTPVPERGQHPAVGCSVRESLYPLHLPVQGVHMYHAVLVLVHRIF